MASAKGKGDVRVFNKREDLSVSLAKYMADLSDKVIKDRGAFTIVVSGGDLFESLGKLVESPYKESLDWSRWHVFWLDERVVPKNHPDSNYLLAYDHFLSKVPILPGNVYAINDALSAEGAADDYETCMGPDGHVASLFPGHPLVQEKEKWVTFIKDSPKPPPERITFTFPVINSSANIALVIVGDAAAHAVHVALDDVENSNVLPIQMVSPEGPLTWFLDNEAASKLKMATDVAK
ncbi:putative 6-phosphogluconolactonase [Heracleum sosnowskyi]|uniref:6-phosphogluconolactonase n=1 Tax=Heracleum sosnowskyi TaxID=360622 RepID=A0AAD8MB79_9APIA|nr:putative 6-phosphogluconolactonase [Heracleum sosnowskyi]